MKLNNLIDVSMEDFIKYAKFDCIKIGQTKEWILNNFADPDGFHSLSYKDKIWLYGTIEFHFDKNKLQLIWCDNLLTAGNNVRLNKWIFDSLPLSLSNFIKRLNSERVDFRLSNSNSDVSICITNSNVKLYFYGDEPEDRNEFHLLAFGLS